ncbi:MAG: hypothetical protein AAFX94_17840, partial [Myxococcota bacterium]
MEKEKHGDHQEDEGEFRILPNSAGLLTRVAAGSIAVTMAVAAFLANGGVWKNAELAFIFLVVSVFFFFHG